MAIFIIFTLFSLILQKTESLKPQCPPLTFPDHSVPNFNFLCNQNKTIIHFPSYGELIVKSISFNPKKLDLIDPKDCVHGVFLNLDLSLTPFHYYYALKDFTYMNCSALVSGFHEPVPCLSGSGYHVYVVEPGFEVPGFCKVLKSVGIPFGYSGYLDDGSFGLGLTWDLECGHDYGGGGGGGGGGGDQGGWFGGLSKLGVPKFFNGAHKSVLMCISIFIMFMVAIMMISAKKVDMVNETKKNHIQEVDNLLGDFEAL